MKKIIYSLILATLMVFTSCENSNYRKWTDDKPITELIDYNDSEVLDSLIKATPFSNDTIFLGFRMGMTKTQYKNHIHDLRNEGNTITYSKSNRYSYPSLGNKVFDYGPGYQFETSISSTTNSDKTTIGVGKYLLLPQYGRKDGGLTMLSIMIDEEWEGTDYRKPKWFEKRIEENSEKISNVNLKNFLIESEIVSTNGLLRKKDNYIIYSSVGSFITYQDLKTVYFKALFKKKENELVKEKSTKVEF